MNLFIYACIYFLFYLFIEQENHLLKQPWPLTYFDRSALKQIKNMLIKSDKH